MGNKTPLWIDQRERDTIIAALRFWQRYALANKLNADDEMEIAENGRTGDDAALLAEEIDALIEEKVNT